MSQSHSRFFSVGLLIIFWILVLGAGFFRNRSDGLLHVFFCDVGQGDAIYIKMPDGTDFLIDGGPNSRVLECLGEHMAFWDRRIEVVFLTHPQKDHYGGLISVAERYTIKSFIHPGIEVKDANFQTLISLLGQSKTSVRTLGAGSTVRHADPTGREIKLSILSPESEAVQGYLEGHAAGTDLNNFSLVMHLRYGQFDAIFTGDAEGEVLVSAFEKLPVMSDGLEVYKVGHHGSADEQNDTIASVRRPGLAVITVGKNNSYGHPHESVIEQFKNSGANVLRTDQNGTVEVITDGKRWKVLN